MRYEDKKFEDKEGRRVVRSGPEVSRRQEMKHDGMTKEPADIINADQSAATFEQTRSDGAVDLSIVQTVQLSVRAYWGSAVRPFGADAELFVR